MRKKAVEPKPIGRPKKLSAQEKLSKFLKEENITLDYEIVPSRIIDVGDGLVVVPASSPVVKIKAEYGK